MYKIVITIVSYAVHLTDGSWIFFWLRRNINCAYTYLVSVVEQVRMDGVTDESNNPVKRSSWNANVNMRVSVYHGKKGLHAFDFANAGYEVDGRWQLLLHPGMVPKYCDEYVCLSPLT